MSYNYFISPQRFLSVENVGSESPSVFHYLIIMAGHVSSTVLNRYIILCQVDIVNDINKNY